MNDDIIKEKINVYGMDYLNIICNAYNIVLELSVEDEKSFRIYQKSEEKLKCVTYDEATFLGRISDEEYCNYMIQLTEYIKVNELKKNRIF